MDPKEIGLHKTNYLLDLVLYVAWYGFYPAVFSGMCRLESNQVL